MSSSEKSVINVPGPSLSKGTKSILLIIFCLAEFMDTFNNSALFPAIPNMASSLDMTPDDAVWVFAAYQATFAAFLLVSGRISDVYSSKWTFLIGASALGAFSLGTGFVHDKVIMFLLRGLAGVCAAMTIPSALSLIVEYFPEEDEQAQALALFGMSAAIANILGLLIGGAFVHWVSWRWIYWFSAIIGIPIGFVSYVVIPKPSPRTDKPSIRKLDVVGVTLAAGALILLIYAVTSGASAGWGSAQVLAPLIISIAMLVVFFIYEAKISEEIASLPPSIWFYPNVGILAGVALIPIFWWASVFFVFSPIWQEYYHWSAIIAAVHFLPTGVVSGTVALFCGNFPKYVNPKWSILGGEILILAGTLLFPWADRSSHYWSFAFPGMCLGTAGTMIAYTNSNIAIFLNTPPEVSGTVGALYNAAVQVGSAVGLAAISSIKTSQDQKTLQRTGGLDPGYSGAKQGWWFSIAFMAAEIIALLIFYKTDIPKIHKTPVHSETGSIASGASSISEATTTVGADAEKKSIIV